MEGDIIRIIFFVLAIIYWLSRQRSKSRPGNPSPRKDTKKKPTWSQRLEEVLEQLENPTIESQVGEEKMTDPKELPENKDLNDGERFTTRDRQEDREMQVEYVPVEELMDEELVLGEEEKAQIYIDNQRKELQELRKQDYNKTHSREPSKIKSFSKSIYKEYKLKKKPKNKFAAKLKNKKALQDAFIMKEILTPKHTKWD